MRCVIISFHLNESNICNAMKPSNLLHIIEIVKMIQYPAVPISENEVKFVPEQKRGKILMS